MDERIAGQLTLLSFYRRYVIAETLTNPFIFEHINGIFVRFCPSGPLFSGISSTKSGFLCSFTKLDVGLGHFPADRGIVALAEPLHLRSRRTCAAAAPAEPLHLRSRYYRSLPPLHLSARAG